MISKIESLRKKPKEVRNRYAFWTALCFTMVIAGFWLMSMPARLQVLTGTPQKTEVQGGVSRWISNTKHMFAGSMEAIDSASTEPLEISVPQEETIDFDTFFSTTSPQAPQTQEKQVLIGTSTEPASDANMLQ